MYVILKQMMPSMENEPNYNEDFNYIDWCTCIENDEVFSYNSIIEAESKIIELQNDNRYLGRKFKIVER